MKEIYRKYLLCLLCLSVGVVACDTLDEDEFAAASSNDLPLFAMVDERLPLLIDWSTIVEQGTTLQLNDTPHRGELTPWVDGMLQYIPYADFTSGADFFSYRLITSDQIRQARYTLTLASADNNEGGTNCTWRPRADSYGLSQAQTLEVNLLENDILCTGLSQLFETSLRVEPQHGTARLSTDGILTYEPPSGFTGTDELAYSLCKLETGECQTALVRLEVVNEVCTDLARYFPITSNEFIPTDTSEYRILEAAISGDCLRLLIEHSGGCGAFRAELINLTPPTNDGNIALERRLGLSFLNHDPCDGLLRSELFFDAQVLRETGQTSGQVQLRVLGYPEVLLYNY